LHLLRRDREACARRPHAVAVAVEDCCAVQVAGADEAARGEMLVGVSSCWEMQRGAERELWGSRG
jgi:hypothetical protein